MTCTHLAVAVRTGFSFSNSDGGTRIYHNTAPFYFHFVLTAWICLGTNKTIFFALHCNTALPCASNENAQTIPQVGSSSPVAIDDKRVGLVAELIFRNPQHFIWELSLKGGQQWVRGAIWHYFMINIFTDYKLSTTVPHCYAL